MVTVVKHEWHQHDRQYAIELDEDLLSEIYPDLGPGEISHMLKNLEEGLLDVEDIINDAWENDVEIEWDFQYDDCWTDRKGGYDVTYEIGDEDSWVEPEKEPEPTHKCTKCRWTGQSYTTLTQYLREDGSVIENYWDSEEEAHDTKDVCPMCDSDVELTEIGQQEKADREKRMAEIDAMVDDEEFDELNDNEVVDLEQALNELKDEFEKLSTATIKCTECEWQGTEDECEKEGICPNCCAYTQPIDSD